MAPSLQVQDCKLALCERTKTAGYENLKLLTVEQEKVDGRGMRTETMC